MTCEEACRQILEADPSRLREGRDTPLSLHLATCSRCLALAREVLEEQDRLAGEMEALVPQPDLDRLLDASTPSTPATPRALRLPRRTLALAALPVAAAAAVVAFLFPAQPRLPGEPYAVADGGEGLGLEVPEGRNVAVLATDNPRITVLWFF